MSDVKPMLNARIDALEAENLRLTAEDAGLRETGRALVAECVRLTVERDRLCHELGDVVNEAGGGPKSPSRDYLMGLGRHAAGLPREGGKGGGA